jgi:hypothetical protein
MAPAISSALTFQDKLAKLADFLEQASTLARELSKAQPFTPRIPELKRPAHVPKDQEWFWTEEWQRGEREANDDLRQGRYKTFDSVEELLADLHAAA